MMEIGNYKDVKRCEKVNGTRITLHGQNERIKKRGKKHQVTFRLVTKINHKSKLMIGNGEVNPKKPLLSSVFQAKQNANFFFFSFLPRMVRCQNLEFPFLTNALPSMIMLGLLLHQ